tara:strand:+ start:1036 stop:1827 length:792 start_codon:yes stop_codon:yes gene_type:complete
MKIVEEKKNIAAKIIDCDVKNLNIKDLKIIKQTLNKFGIIFFINQNLNPKEYITFAKKLGRLAKYPRLKGLSKIYPQITVVERKKSDKGPSFGEQFHTDSSYTKKPPKFTMLLSRKVPKPGLANTEFSSQYLAYKYLSSNLKKKLSRIKGIYSSNGPIAVTTLERSNEKGKLKKELISKHKIVKKIKGRKTLYCSPGHLIDFTGKYKGNLKLKKLLTHHQIKKKFQFSLKWNKNQLAIWDNRSMLHQATPFKGERVMHRITIL